MTKQIVWNIPSDDKSLTFEGGFGFWKDLTIFKNVQLYCGLVDKY